jgi:hypothetical protein
MLEVHHLGGGCLERGQFGQLIQAEVASCGVRLPSPYSRGAGSQMVASGRGRARRLSRAGCAVPSPPSRGKSQMLTSEESQLVSRVGPGTPMGDLMRRYWVPALLSRELPAPDSDPVRVALLGEKLIAFRAG